jgi:hypothetical protein
MKIYTDDPNLPYKTTKLNALYSRHEIDGLFAKWGIKDVYWHWEPEANSVYAMFKIKEEIEGISINVSARVDCPAIWDKKTRNHAEKVNWNISIRVMYWYIKSHLEEAYLRQSSKVAAFLSDLSGKDEKQTLKDIIIPHITDLQNLPSLPKKPIIIEERM